MGNLLGTPVIDKETHVGHTDEFEFGLSSMQGWRVHMEDAHIAEANLYAIVTANASTPATGNASSSPSKAPKKQTIELPGHSFFGIFDGHGGTFAAQYTGDNLCRILSKQPMFVEYARFYQESMTKTFESPAEKIQFLRSGVDFLEAALKQAFVEIDCEIAMAIRGTPHPDANTPYQRPGTSNSASADHAANTMDAARKEAVHRARALDDDGDSGTTACCVLVTPDWLVCANAGDSRAVFSKKSRAVPLSYDHKPDDEGEERRIRAAGGYVAGGRVEGDLAVSRGLGDFRFKHMPTVLANIHLITGKPQREISEGQTLMKPGDQKVSPIPDIILQTRNREQDEFVIVACDGIWDVQTNQDCVTEVANMFQEGETNIGLLCEELLDTCLQLGSKDNMTALVVKFKAQEVGTGGGVQARRKHREEDMKGGDDITSLVEGEEKESSHDENGRHDEQHDAPEDNGDLKPKPIEL